MSTHERSRGRINRVGHIMSIEYVTNFCHLHTKALEYEANADPVVVEGKISRLGFSCVEGICYTYWHVSEDIAVYSRLCTRASSETAQCAIVICQAECVSSIFKNTKTTTVVLLAIAKGLYLGCGGCINAGACWYYCCVARRTIVGRTLPDSAKCSWFVLRCCNKCAATSSTTAALCALPPHSCIVLFAALYCRPTTGERSQVPHPSLRPLYRCALPASCGPGVLLCL